MHAVDAPERDLRSRGWRLSRDDARRTSNGRPIPGLGTRDSDSGFGSRESGHNPRSTCHHTRRRRGSAPGLRFEGFPLRSCGVIGPQRARSGLTGCRDRVGWPRARIPNNIGRRPRSGTARVGARRRDPPLFLRVRARARSAHHDGFRRRPAAGAPASIHGVCPTYEGRRPQHGRRRLGQGAHDRRVFRDLERLPDENDLEIGLEGRVASGLSPENIRISPATASGLSPGMVRRSIWRRQLAA